MERKGKPSEKIKQKMEEGELNEDVTSEEGREALVEDDEIEPWEEAFSEGAEQKGELATCANCNKVLSQSKKNTIEREIDGELFWFCSGNCAKNFKVPETKKKARKI